MHRIQWLDYSGRCIEPLVSFRPFTKRKKTPYPPQTQKHSKLGTLYCLTAGEVEAGGDFPEHILERRSFVCGVFYHDQLLKTQKPSLVLTVLCLFLLEAQCQSLCKPYPWLQIKSTFLHFIQEHFILFSPLGDIQQFQSSNSYLQPDATNFIYFQMLLWEKGNRKALRKRYLCHSFPLN